MSWDQGYKSPDERADEQRAAAAAHQQTQMSHFERSLLNYLGEISQSLGQLVATVGRVKPAYPVCPDCGAEQPIAQSDHMDSLIEARTATGDGGGTSAEPDSPPGSARPDSTESTR